MAFSTQKSFATGVGADMRMFELSSLLYQPAVLMRITGTNDGLVHINQDNPLPVTTKQTVDAAVKQLLSTNGLPGGTTEAAADFSSTADDYYAQPGAGIVWRVTELHLIIEDNVTSFNADGFGSLAAVTNGLLIKATDTGGTILDLAPFANIKRNGDIAIVFDGYAEYIGATNSFIKAVIRFPEPIRLVGDDSGRMVVTLNDDFSALVSLRFMVNGYVENIT